MIEQKTRDELLAEIPEAWRSPSTLREGPSSILDDWDGAQEGLRELIARRAYELYEERGRTDGDDLNDWLRAETEVRSSTSSAGGVVVETPKRQRRSVSGGER
jgi:hypothetical protein